MCFAAPWLRHWLLASVSMLVVLLASTGCSTMAYKAPPKRHVLQAQLQAIGRTAEIDIAGVLEAARPAIDAGKEVDLEKVRAALKAALPSDESWGFDAFWKAVLTRSGIQKDAAEFRVRLRHAIREQLAAADEDNRLYWRAKGATGRAEQADKDRDLDTKGMYDPRGNRDALISKYIIRIQDYHEANYEDVFFTAADIGFKLDAGTTIASALATAFTPLSTKTALAATATILAGTRLSASKNVLHEKDSGAILNAMITQRTVALTAITNGMKEPISRYSVDTALIELFTYFNAGGLDKALAQMEEDTSKAKSAAEKDLKIAQDKPAVSGTFGARSELPDKGLIAELHPKNDDATGAISVEDVVVDGKVLDETEYSISSDNNKLMRVTLLPNPAFKKGNKVSITGTCAKAGKHSAEITWLE